MTPTFHTLRAAIGAETWAVTCQMPTGDVYCPEFDPRIRAEAFEAATQAFNDGCAVEVIRIHRNTWSNAPLSVSDYTLIWMQACGIDPDRSDIYEPGYGPDCDDKYDEWKAEA